MATPALAITAPPPPAAPAGRPQVSFASSPDTSGVITATLDAVQPPAAGALVTTLSQHDTDALLARLEPLPDLSGKPAPVVRAPSLAPPANGTITPIAFVGPVGATIADKPVGAAPDAPPPPLAPPQILPTGEVSAESQIRVRFTDAMVPVAAVGSSQPPAVTISPAVAGTWRWVDTRVAEFTPSAARLPQATDFTVTVAAGARSVTGSTLQAPLTATFSTRPMTIEGTFPPNTPLRPDSAIGVLFDQDIDPAAIAKFLTVEVGESKRAKIAFRTVTLDEARALWAKNPALAHIDDKKLGKHYVLLAPKTAWPSGVRGRIALGKGAPSQEGPRLSERVTDEGFEIVPEFRLTGLSCDRAPSLANVSCQVKTSVAVNFSNPIDLSTFRSKKIQIQGTPFQDESLQGDSVSLDVPATIGASYTVAIGDGLVDVYGQPFLGPHAASFTTKRIQYAPQLFAPQGLYVLDPRYAIPQWSVRAEAVGTLRLELYRVAPADYFAYEAFENGKRAAPPGTRVYDKTYTIGPRQGGDAHVELTPALRDGVGHVIAIATVSAPKRDDFSPRAVAWIEVSKLGVSARFDRERALAWVQDIAVDRSLVPVAGATTSVLVEGKGALIAPVTTDAEGKAGFDFVAPIDPKDSHSAILLAERGSDSAFVATSRFERTSRSHMARWYVTDDRFTYKPGEKVYVKGWVRWTHDGSNPDISLPQSGDTVGYTLVDARGNKIADGKVDFDDHGGFDVEVELPSNVNLGTAWFTFDTRNATDRLPISVEEFRTPAYAVNLDDDVSYGGVRPLVLGETIEMNAEAKYYAGGGLAGAGIEWSASLREAHYQPPGWDMYSFRTAHAPHAGYHGGGTEDRRTSSLSGSSSSSVRYAIESLADGAPAVLSVDATVTDIDRQSIRASSRAILVHPADYYVGVRKMPDADDKLQVVVTDIDGNPAPGVAIDVEITGVLGSERSRTDAEIKDTQHCKLTSAAVPVICAWRTANVDYAYHAVARVADSRGRPNSAEYDIPWWQTHAAPADFSVTSDKHEYRPGETAKIEIHTKEAPATAMVTFARSGIVSQKRVELATETTTVELPIEVGYISNIHVVVDLVANQPSKLKASNKPLPEHKIGRLDLAVDIDGARLITTAKPTRPAVAPGAEATFEVRVARGDKPVAGAQVALIVVDEAVLAVSGGHHNDPLGGFYRRTEEGTWEVSSLGEIRNAGEELAYKPGFARENLDETGRGTGYGGGGTGWGTIGSGRYGTIGHGMGSGSAVVQARKDFRANALFAPRLVTDANGRATATVKMPDSLTRFRVIALTSAEAHYFGLGESTIVTQRPVNVRTVAPRFLTQGDAFAVPVVVQNLDSVPRTIDVAMRAANLDAKGPQGKRVTVPAGQRAEVRFDFATHARGKVAIQTIAVTGGLADASQIEVPVYEPATTESFATYGVVDDAPKFERLDVPGDIFTEVGGVEAEVSSTQMQALTDAYWYLYAYPYECAEQRSSRMLATAYMSGVLDAFAVPGRPSRTELDEQRKRDVARLVEDQLPDGGWGYFSGMRSDPYVTIQVFSALVASKQFDNHVAKARAFVDNLATKTLAGLEKAVKTPIRKGRADEPYDVSLTAAALTALADQGTDVSARALRLHAAAVALGTYPMDAKARVLALVAKQPKAKAARAQLKADILAAAHETAAGATIATAYVEAERLLLPSSNKTNALALDALIKESPDEPLVDKLARGLLGARKRGRWLNTQENLAVMKAMRRYFDVYEKDTPNYTGKLWFGTAAYAEQTFAGRSQLRATTKLDWTQLAANSRNDIAMQKTGPGRMYYRIGITYAPKQPNLPPLDAGFVVRRSYEGAEHASDVVHLPDGTWKIKLGAKVNVVIETVSTTTRYAVALADPLPAGLESVNTRLATSERASANDTYDWDHVEMRDNRSEAFAMTLREGTHRFVYATRATTPGKFIAAPTKAEEMYSPETFGRSSGAVVVVE